MRKFFLQTFILFLSVVGLLAQEEEWEYPLGPVGATFKTHSAAPYARIVSVADGSPGQLAGLQVDDYISGIAGKGFGFTDRDDRATFTGVLQDLGEGIERAYRFNNGFLELDVLRPSVGKVSLNITLPSSDGLGAAFPLGSTSTAANYDSACHALHEMFVDGAGSYAAGFGGLVLLSHPNFNDVDGTKPYRLSIYFIRQVN